MRTLAGIAIGLTVSILVYALWRPTTAWALTRIPPGTPPDHQPRHRHWVKGELVIDLEPYKPAMVAAWTPR